MRLGKVFVDSVVVGERHRALDPAKVNALAESMKDIGLQQPIGVFLDGQDGTTARLIAGLHRLEAARSLGWESVDASFIDLSVRKREIWEIDENLMRNELSGDEKREHLLRRKAIWDQEQEEKNRLAHDAPPEIGYKKPPRKEKGFAADTAEKTGLSKSQINRLLAPPKQPPQVVDDGEPDMHDLAVAHANKLAKQYTVGQLQEYLDHFTDAVAAIIKNRLAAA